MKKLKIFSLVLFGLYLNLITPAMACSCFTPENLHAMFFNNTNLHCEIHMHAYVVMARITDGVDMASGFTDGCELRFHETKINKDYSPFSDEHTECINDIVNVCQALGLETKHSDFP